MGLRTQKSLNPRRSLGIILSSCAMQALARSHLIRYTVRGQQSPNPGKAGRKRGAQTLAAQPASEPEASDSDGDVFQPSGLEEDLLASEAQKPGLELELDDPDFESQYRPNDSGDGSYNAYSGTEKDWIADLSHDFLEIQLAATREELAFESVVLRSISKRDPDYFLYEAFDTLRNRIFDMMRKVVLYDLTWN